MKKTPRDIYIEIKSSAPVDIDDRLLEVLRQCIGKENAITRRSLVWKIYEIDLSADDDLSTSSFDRTIRDSISRLQDQYPIISSSGNGGYWWAESMEEINAYAAEIVSRATKLLEKSRRLERAAREFYAEPQQMRLL